jgi:pimeloyl-ACP methyl ester carboxylesterase
MQAAAGDQWLEREGLRYCHRVLRHPNPQFAPTLFLSGAFQTMNSWARFANLFVPYTTVLLMDPPGMGWSDVLPPEFGVDFLAGCVDQLVETHQFRRINIIAASYGTPAAYRFAQLHPDRVDRIVLVGTMKEIPGHIRQKVTASVATAMSGNRERLAEQVVDGLLCRDPHLAVDRRAVAERVLRSALLRMSDMELRQYAANTTRLLRHEALNLTQRVRGPEALVFTGEHDCFTLPGHCKEVADAFDSGLFTTVRRADHLLHLEQFDVVSTLFLRFMQGTLVDAPVGCGRLEACGLRN